MLDNIPTELRLLPQWVVAGPNKEPINPRTGQPASVTDRSTWATFEEARHAGYPHVGFVLAKEDPYTIIDLDDPATLKIKGVEVPNPDVEKTQERHRRIFQAFNSYAELSQSGRGVHIIVRGSIPSGVRRDRVEVYSDARYMICTGNVINNLAITDHQPLLEAIHKEMASTVATDLVERDAVMTDEALWDMGAHAANGDKFRKLWQGDIPEYPSQSEADFALLTILCFYSKSDEQVRRVFRMSELGKRDKAQRNDDYLNRALSKIRGRQAVPQVDLSALMNQPLPPPPSPRFENPPQVNTPPTNTPEPVVVVTPPSAPVVSSCMVNPPGLIGEMAEYMFSSAYRPVREISLAAALGFGAGIMGRQWNVSNTGLNQYLVLLAKTGTGKEGAVGGIDALLAAMRSQIPVADEFVGPGTFASGQALTRVLDKNPCFVSVLGEVGLTLQQICEKNAGSHNVQLRKVLLDVYAKSGWSKWLRPSVYSDTEKNTGLVRAPNVTILGESTPENFYGALDSTHISEGLIPRFLVIEYEGLRPPPNARAFHPPHPGLVQQLVSTCQTALTMKNNDANCPVQMDSWAKHALDEWNAYADHKINHAAEDEVLKQLWNRAHLKALKLAALVAVGCNIHQPIITKDVAGWAIQLVTRDIENMAAKFSTGKVGAGDHAQEADLRAACDRYPHLTVQQRAQYKVPQALLEKPMLVPYVYLKRYLSLRASFKNDRRGAVVALKVALDDMIKSGQLAQIPAPQAKTELNVDSPVYYRGEAW